jgi:phage repressor protein C with HTH and peptisase S24 domain
MKSIRDIRRDNLALLLAQHPSRTALANKIGKDPNQVYQWQRKDDDPAGRAMNDGTARHFEQALGLPLHWMDQDHAEAGTVPPAKSIMVPAFSIRGIDGHDGIDPETDVMIPVTDVEVSAGAPDSPPHFEFLPTRYELPYQLSWLHTHRARPQDILVMPVRGRSMEDVLFNGDLAVLHRGRTRVLDGAVYAFVEPGGPRIKRLYKTAAGGLRVVSHNRDKARYPDEVVAPEDMFRVIILGQAIDRHGAGGLGPLSEDRD